MPANPHAAAVRIVVAASFLLSVQAGLPPVLNGAGGEEIPELIQELEASDPGRRDTAVQSLASLGPDALPQIFHHLTLALGPRANRMAREGRPEDAVFEQVLDESARALEAMGPAAAVPLARHLTSGKVSLESELSARALDRFGSRAAGAIPVLTDALDSENHTARWGGMVGLVAVDGPEYANLRALLSSESPERRRMAIIGLGKTHSPVALDPLLGVLGDPGFGMVSDLFEAIGELGPVAAPSVPTLLGARSFYPGPVARIGESAIPALVEALEGADEGQRDRASQALSEMGEPAVPSLVALLKDSDPEIRIVAANTIAEGGEGMQGATPGLVHLAGDPSPRAREAGIRALGQVGSGAEGLEAVLGAVEDPDPCVRWTALQTLGSFGEAPERVRPVIEAHLSSEDKFVRLAAMQGLWRLRPGNELESIYRAILSRDADDEVRRQAEAYLAAITFVPGPPPEVPTAPGEMPPPPPPPTPPPTPPLPSCPDSPSADRVQSGKPDAIRPPVRVGGSIPMPQKTKHVEPVAPPETGQGRARGPVVLECTIGIDGRVTGTQILRSVPLLDQAVVDAVRQWVYEPTVIDGVAVPVLMTVTVDVPSP